tara:strand:+ start:248 stop:481 length:234 start_codon:yes stop_codon:yes gene_type:complete
MRTEGYWNANGHWRYKPTQSEQQITKVEPIDRVINDCRRRADDAWWEGQEEEAKLEEAYIKLHEQEKEEGILWVPNF